MLKKLLNQICLLATIWLLNSIVYVHSDDKSKAVTLALVGGQLIDGYGGKPVNNSVILISGNIITDVGDQNSIKIPNDIKVISTEGMSILPGLIDVHVHFDILGHSDYTHWFSKYKKDRIQHDIMPAAAKILLHAGVTSARDLGADPNSILWLKKQIDSGKLQGPRVYAAGPYLIKSKADYIVGEYNDTWEINTATDARKKVQQVIKLGVDVIKTKVKNLGRDELIALISEAHKHNMPVAVHLFDQAELRLALSAGLTHRDTIEHIGSGYHTKYPEDIINSIIESGAIMAPTIMVDEGLRQLYLNPELLDHPDWQAFIPKDLYKDIHGSYQNIQRHSLFQRAIYMREGKFSKLKQLKKAGMRFVLSTDSGTRGNPHHAAAWRELYYLSSEVGLTPMEAIMGATQFAAKILGKDKALGTIAENKLADIIVVDGNPLENIRDIKLIKHVIKDGKIIR